MSGIETMAIDVPDGLLSKVRELAGADGHGSGQDAIRVALVSHFGFPDTVEEIDDDFLDREVLPILDAIERGEEELIPAEQVFAEIRAEMAQRARRRVRRVRRPRMW